MIGYNKLALNVHILSRFGVCPDSVQTEANGNMFYQTFISLEGDPIETLTCKVILPQG